MAYSSLTTPDTVLDRHYPTNTYIGSGAWLTNHATGTYTSSTEFHWDIDGNWLLDFAGGTGNRAFRNLVQDVDGNVTGEFWYLPSVGDWQYGGTLVGTLVDNILTLHYDRNPAYVYTGDFVGTVGGDVITGGTFTDSNGGSYSWTATGTSVQVFDTCTVSDFVKIVAVPTTAKLDPSVPDFYGEGMWYTDGTYTTEIGPALWGDFAVIQEMASDPCGEYGVIDYFSPFKKGLGNWAY